MGDAVIALTTNLTLKNSFKGEGGYTRFKEEWFDVNSDETPDGSTIASATEYMNKPVA